MKGGVSIQAPLLLLSTILETPVTEQGFLEQLHELNNKINAVKEQAFRETRACADVADILDKLKAKVRGPRPEPFPSPPLRIPPCGAVRGLCLNRLTSAWDILCRNAPPPALPFPRQWPRSGNSSCRKSTLSASQ